MKDTELNNISIENNENEGMIDDKTQKAEIDAQNKSIRAEMGADKLNSIFTSFSQMSDGSADKDKASHLIGMLERGFMPLEMRQYGNSTSFINKHPEFKMDIRYNEDYKSNAVNDRNINDVRAIRSIDNPTKDSMLGREFAIFMGIDTSKAYYLKDEDGLIKDFKEELYGNFDKSYYDNIDKVYICNDIPRESNFKNPAHNYIKDIPFGDRTAVKGFVSLQITTFEVHKIDGDIEYKSYFTNNAGQVLAEIPDSGKAEILLGDSRDSKCEAINTANIELSNIPKDFDSKLWGASMSTIEGCVNRQSYNITQNAELNKNEVDVLSGNKDILKSAINCIYAEKSDTMSPLKEAYTDLDNKAKSIANEIKVLEITDKNSADYSDMKAELEQHISEYKEALTSFDEKYKNTEQFDDKKLSDVISLYNNTLDRLDRAETRIEIAESDIIKDKKIEPLTRFRGIIGVDRSTSFGSNIDFNGVKDSTTNGKNIIEERIQSWNDTHKDSPLKIEDTASGFKIYDKHGFERNIQDIVGDNTKTFNPDMVDEGASSPERDENGTISQDAIDSFIAEDEDIYKEFEESFGLSDIIIDRDYESLIEKYVDDENVEFSDYGLDNQALKDELAVINGEKEEDYTENTSDDFSFNEKELDNSEKELADFDDDHKYEDNKGSDVKTDFPRPDSKHIDYKGKIEISEEKKEAIKKEIEKELKGVSNEIYKDVFEQKYKSRVNDANQTLRVIADKINTLEKGVKNRTDRLGMRASNQNLVVINDRSKIDGLIEDYKKAGGAIGKGNFVQSTPTFLDKFSRVVEVYHSNIFNTGIYEAFLKIDTMIHPEREEPYKVDTDRNHLSNDESPDNLEHSGVESESLSLDDKIEPEKDDNILKGSNIEEDNTDNLVNDKIEADIENINPESSISNEEKEENKMDKDDAKVISDAEDAEKDNSTTDEEPEKDNIETDNDKDRVDGEQDKDTSKDDDDNVDKDEKANITDDNSDNLEEKEDDIESKSTQDDSEDQDNQIESSDNDEDIVEEMGDAETESQPEIDNESKDIEGEPEKEPVEQPLDEENPDVEEQPSDEELEKIDTGTDEEDDDSAVLEDSEKVVAEDTDIPEESADKEADIENEPPSELKKVDNSDNTNTDNEDKENRLIDDIKADIEKKIENYFDDSDTILDKIESFLENLSPMDLIDFCIDVVTGIYEHLAEIFSLTGDDVIEETGFLDKASELFSNISETASDSTESPADSFREDMMKKISDSDLPDSVSDVINNGISENVFDSDTVSSSEIDGVSMTDLGVYSADDKTADIEKNVSDDMGVSTDVANESKASVAVNNTANDLEDSGFSSEDSHNIASNAVNNDLDNGFDFDDDSLSIPTDDSLNKAVTNYEAQDNNQNQDTELQYSNNNDFETNYGSADISITAPDEINPNDYDEPTSVDQDGFSNQNDYNSDFNSDVGTGDDFGSLFI